MSRCNISINVILGYYLFSVCTVWSPSRKELWVSVGRQFCFSLKISTIKIQLQMHLSLLFADYMS